MTGWLVTVTRLVCNVAALCILLLFWLVCLLAGVPASMREVFLIAAIAIGFYHWGKA